MTADFAFVAMGQSSLKVIAPLVVAAKQLEKECVVLWYPSRPGKPDDTLRMEHVALLQHLGARCVMVENPSSLVTALQDECPAHVVLQDAQWHFASVVKSDLRSRVSSISVFTDTMHWSLSYHDPSLVPAWTYFPDEICRSKVEDLSGHRWHGSCMGSPMFDHAMWLDQTELEPPLDGSVLFLSPHPALLTNDQMRAIEALERHVGPTKFRALQRRKHERDLSMKSEILGVDGIPYSSFRAIASADIHINCYSISGFEAQFLGRPMLNLQTLCQDGSLGNVKVRNYGLDSVYAADNRMTVPAMRSNLVAVYEHLVSDQRPMKRIITATDSYSIDILRHVLSRG